MRFGLAIGLVFWVGISDVSAFEVTVRDRCELPLVTADNWNLDGGHWTHGEIDRCEDDSRQNYRVGCNVNGPSVIHVPKWLGDERLKIRGKPAKYYMYFAHHNGDSIRVAYSRRICGPWHVHEPGTLQLFQAKTFRGHIASPDVHVDHKNHRIMMYFHGPKKGKKRGQKTGVAISSDGLRFVAEDDALGGPYFRVFTHKNKFYSLAFGWNFLDFYSSENPFKKFTKRIRGDDDFVRKSEILPGGRHTGLLKNGSNLYVFFSRIDHELIGAGLKADSPERILAGVVDLSKSYNSWHINDIREVLKPEKDWEGARLPISLSKSGLAKAPVHQLRDPYIFKDGRKLYLFYSGAGEFSIGAAEIQVHP